MFIAPFAIGFAVKRFAAPFAGGVDSVATVSRHAAACVLLLGRKHARIAPGDTRYAPFDLFDYPWPHSLPMSMVGATAFALIYFGGAGYKAGAVTIWSGV